MEKDKERSLLLKLTLIKRKRGERARRKIIYKFAQVLTLKLKYRISYKFYASVLNED